MHGYATQLKRIGTHAILAVVVLASASAGWLGPRRIARETSSRVQALRAVRLALRSRHCRDLAGEERVSCVDAILQPAAKRGDVGLAMSALVQMADADHDIAAMAHVYAHAIGIAAGAETRDVYQTFEACSPRFDAG